MNPLPDDWRILVPAALGGFAVWSLLPREGKRPWLIGSLCGLASLVLLFLTFRPVGDEWVQDALFYLFGGGAIVCGTMLVTDRNPIYAALWFALVTLCTCGLFLLNSAPFLSAATIVVYAGAIVVTFVFVIMLAQNAGTSNYDRRAFQPTLATLGALLLASSLLYTLDVWGGQGTTVDAESVASSNPRFLLPPADKSANPLSVPIDGDLGSLNGVGRSLFGDYLYAVELAGTALLIATIGTIALVPRRAQGQL